MAEEPEPSVVVKEEPKDRVKEEFQRLAVGLPRARSEGGMMVIQKRESIGNILPAGIGEEAFLTAAIAESNELPVGCRPLTIAIAVFNAASLGLMFGKIRGEAYLVPYKDKSASNRDGKDVYDVSLIIGYQGFRNLAYNSGFLQSFTTEVILEGETFNCHMDEDGRKVYHELPIGRQVAPGGKNVVGAYCVYHTRTGGKGLVLVSAEELKALNRGSIWSAHFAAMARKTAIRRAAKEWAITGKLQAAAVIDEEADSGLVQSCAFDANLLMSEMSDGGRRRKTGESSVQAKLEEMRKGSGDDA